MEIKIPYYEDNSRISNSAIGWYLKHGPQFLRDKLDGKIPDEKSSAMDRGTMIHMYLLQPEEFDKTYEVFNGLLPRSDNQKKFCEELANSIELEPNKALLSAYKASYKVTTQNDDLTLSKAQEMASTYAQYIDLLKRKSDKIQINSYDVNMLEKISANVREHGLAYDLLYPKTGENHHEFHINWDWCDVPCKSLLDCCTFNITTKTCTLVDIKTTVHLWQFEESVKLYDYTRQLCFYKCALEWYINNVLDDESSKWSFKYYIIAIDTTGRYDVRVFDIREEQIDSRWSLLFNVIKAIKYHISSGNWKHSIDYYNFEGRDFLNLDD